MDFVNTPGKQKLAAVVEFPDFMFKTKQIWMMLVGEFSNKPSRCSFRSGNYHNSSGAGGKSCFRNYRIHNFNHSLVLMVSDWGNLTPKKWTFSQVSEILGVCFAKMFMTSFRGLP